MYKLIIILNLVIIWGNQFNYNKLINTNSYFKKYTFNIFIGLRVTYMYLYSFVLVLFSTQYYIHVYFLILFLFCFCKANNFSGDGVSHFSTSSAVALWPFLVATPFV